MPVAHAFTFFTERFDGIKPREHNMLAVDIAQTILEPWPGGRLVDIGTDGSTCQWGRVLTVDAPHRIIFAWDISPHWQIETDPSYASEVEFTFTDLGTDATRVILEHRHLDHHSDGWQSAREAVAGGSRWPLYFRRFIVLVSGNAEHGR